MSEAETILAAIAVTVTPDLLVFIARNRPALLSMIEQKLVTESVVTEPVMTEPVVTESVDEEKLLLCIEPFITEDFWEEVIESSGGVFSRIDVFGFAWDRIEPQLPESYRAFAQANDGMGRRLVKQIRNAQFEILKAQGEARKVKAAEDKRQKDQGEADWYTKPETWRLPKPARGRRYVIDELRKILHIEALESTVPLVRRMAAKVEKAKKEFGGMLDHLRSVSLDQNYRYALYRVYEYINGTGYDPRITDTSEVNIRRELSYSLWWHLKGLEEDIDAFDHGRAFTQDVDLWASRKLPFLRQALDAFAHDLTRNHPVGDYMDVMAYHYEGDWKHAQFNTFAELRAAREKYDRERHEECEETTRCHYEHLQVVRDVFEPLLLTGKTFTKKNTAIYFEKLEARGYVSHSFAWSDRGSVSVDAPTGRQLVSGGGSGIMSALADFREALLKEPYKSEPTTIEQRLALHDRMISFMETGKDDDRQCKTASSVERAKVERARVAALGRV